MFFLKKIARKTFLSAICGLLAGGAAALFLRTLDFATQTRIQNPALIWGLPVAGFFIGWVYFKFGKDVSSGPQLIFEEIRDPKNILPLKMAPFILGGTLLTHLFGGSAGREGTAVQMGASLSDQLSHFFKIESVERKILLVAGAGAGFGAAIGAPWAGALFGMEVATVGTLGKFRFFALFECLVASFVGYYTTLLLGVVHTPWPAFNEAFDFRILFWVGVAGIAFGFASRFFIVVSHGIEKLNARFINYPPLRPLIGGIVIVALYSIESSYRYVGLGLPLIQEAFMTPNGFQDPLLKSLFTSLTVGSGFKGGEFIPLVFIGTTLGSALSLVLPISLKLLAAVGFAAVFAGAAHVPIACTFMAMEIFGWSIAPYALLACLVSYFVSGSQGLYKLTWKR